MRNKTFHFLAAFLMVFAVSCQNTGKDSDTSKEEEKSQSMEINASVKAELEAIKDKSNDLMERISNATYAERQNLQDDVENFVSETRETLTEMETDSELEQGVEDMVHNLKENTNILVEEAKKFSTQTEEQWEEATTNLENKMKEISGEIEAFFSD
ncbi:MAG: hypothetical protein P1P82_06140 [Bacteroidales bacterium]|nr:hypothetical protein [Bacteroidales bacterium]MDT8430472.1 hypothetical protein [Bacteroidales bacterium]